VGKQEVHRPVDPRLDRLRWSGKLAWIGTRDRELDPERLGDHIDRLYRAALGLTGNTHDAHDLVQETYVRVLAKARFLRDDDDLGYLLRVMRNVWISAYRTTERRPRTRAVPESVESIDPRAGGAADRAVAVREVFAAIAALDGPFRDALVAVDLVGLSYGEAARALGTKETTIASRLHRARARIAAGIDSGLPGVLEGEAP